LIWQNAINNLASVAPTNDDQTILFQSFESLSPWSYMQFLNRALDLYSQGKIKLIVFENIFFPAGKMQFFISHNYDQPEVAAFLEKAEEVLKKKGEPLMFNVQEARSGKLKQLHDVARAQHLELTKLPIPLLRPPVKPLANAASITSTSIQQSEPVTWPTPTVDAEKPESGFPIVLVAIMAALLVGGAVFLLRR
jgi:hypothetical protein